MQQLAASDANPYKIRQLRQVLEEIGKNPDLEAICNDLYEEAMDAVISSTLEADTRKCDPILRIARCS